MATYSGCLSTLLAGDVPAEVPGTAEWTWTEEAENTQYSDNTTGCGKGVQTGAVVQTGTIKVNLQTGAAKGKPPFRAKDVVQAQFHIDDTTENYWGGEIVILGMGGNQHTHESSDPVNVEYNFQVQGELVGFGTLADA